MKRTGKTVALALVLAGTLVFGLVPVEAKMIPKVTNFVILVDQSGSMFEKRFGQQEVKSTLAKDILLAMNERIPELGYTGAIQLFAPDRTLIGPETYDRSFFANSLENIQYVLVRILLALAVASSFFVAWANLLLARPMLKSRGLFYPEFGALKLWKAPERLVWGVIGCGLMLFLPGRTFKILGLNGMIVFMAIYFFQGIAIVAFSFEKKRFPKMLRFFLYSLIVIQQLIFLLVIGLGFFDMWLNFRKLGIQKN